MKRNVKCLFAVLFVLFMLCNSTHAQPPCDPAILPEDIPGLAYGPRGNRCEGFYRSKVTAKIIDVVGLVRGTFDFEWNEKEVIRLVSSFKGKTPISVRAVGIPSKTYYRMDAKIGHGETLIWPLDDVIFPKKLHPDKIGVYGWAKNGTETIYMPVAKIGETAKEINLCLRSSVDTDKLQWRISEIVQGKYATSGKWQSQDKAFRAGEPIRIRLDAGKGEGLYVEVAAKESGRTEWKLRSQFHIMLRNAK